MENRAENSEADKGEVPRSRDVWTRSKTDGCLAGHGRGQSDDRMTIHVFHDGERVMSKLADTKRIDLQRNGIGDGGYAFDLQLPQAAASAPEGLSVVAESPKDGVQLKLPRPSAEERAAEAAIALPLSIVMKKLDRVISIQGQSALGQRDATELLKKTTSRIDELASTEGELGEAFEDTEERPG